MIIGKRLLILEESKMMGMIIMTSVMIITVMVIIMMMGWVILIMQDGAEEDENDHDAWWMERAGMLKMGIMTIITIIQISASSFLHYCGNLPLSFSMEISAPGFSTSEKKSK